MATMVAAAGGTTGNGERLGDFGAAAAGGTGHDGETSAVLCVLRELFEEDPCLLLLAKDMLRQAATRPGHAPPMAHTVHLSTYSALLGGRDPAAVAAAAAGGASSLGANNGTRQVGFLGAAALQAAVQTGQVRVHVCAYQPPAAVPQAETGAAGSRESSATLGHAWQPAIVLEWPAASRTVSMSALPPLPAATPFSALSYAMMSAPAPAPRGPLSNAQLRLHFLDNDGTTSSAALTLEGGHLIASTAGHPPVIHTGSDAAMRSASVPSLSFGMAGALGPQDAGADGHAAGDRAPAVASGMEPAAGGCAGVDAAADTAGVAAAGASTRPLSSGGAADGAAASGPELAPLAGAELLYVIQTWQRHHLLLASVPYAITLFDCQGRVLQQNQVRNT
ncbi:hypothetical protein GPECTOR_7g1137 [Gonium pectorale]|uniref:Uncharacterized protein n=1 Tax=Gonium pectorale TaxID=33097 RepID=A0A150GU20_GONPE|nr:hypothetical protein GPECTOR_7g1137 [Gonium pectorale]|eukprot:KXZ53243.1 hypothetical protein GPECTOR_7g1137 [Gonium pectorale]